MKHGILSCAALLAGASVAFAGPPITQVKSEVTFELRADANFTLDDLEVARIENAQGLRAAGQMALGYSESLETLEILEAYTTTKEGKRIDVGADGVHEQESRQSSGAPTFSDRKVKVIVFPQLEVGSTVTAHWRRTQIKAQIPGFFSMWESSGRGINVESGTVTLRAPASLDLHIDTRDVDGGEIEKTADGLRQWRWSFRPSKGAPPEPRQVSGRDLAPYVIASTFASYEDLARAYDTRAAAKAEPTPEIRKLADEITQGIKDRRAQAQALYAWVSKNIRYVALVLDDGGYVPHAAGDIYEARYGDCKDHVVLLQALLTAKKIRSSAVLIQAGDSFLVPNVVAARAFNHAITWLPDFDLFVDSTPGVLPFGVLSPVEYGKQALVIDAGHGKPAMRTLPLPTAANDWTHSRVEYSVSPDGTLSGRTHGQSSGMYEGIDRQVFSATTTEQRTRAANQAIRQAGSISLESGDPRDLATPFQYGSKDELPKYYKLPGPGAYKIPFGNGRFGGSLTQFVEMMAEPSRTLPMLCPAPGKRTETVNIKLTPAMKITQLPQAVNQKVKYGGYEATFEIKDDTLIATSALTLEYPSAVCGPADYAELRDLAATIAKVERDQFFYD